jgi:GNAT superfamily N-acetyltransferase
MALTFQIETASVFSDQRALREALERIFFLCSSRQTFSDEQERSAFSDRWLNPYWQHFPEWIYAARAEEGTIIGYLTGCPDSRLFQGKYLPGMEVFEDLYDRFPAHLHINCHPDWRGQGVGSALVSHYLKTVSPKAGGVHIITGADARNRDFYGANGFHVEEQRQGLALMGRSLQVSPA